MRGTAHLAVGRRTVRRGDDATWALPAGSLELEESIPDCCIREVKEETSLDVRAATPIARYSAPCFPFTNAHCGRHRRFFLVFRVDAWSGTLAMATDETVDARFFPLDALPALPALYAETLDDLRRYTGALILK